MQEGSRQERGRREEKEREEGKEEAREGRRAVIDT